jgi:uncharacterized protein
MPKTLNYLTKQLIIRVILFYQETLSPDHGWFKARYPYGFCRFYPTCSQYALEALQSRGIILGLIMTSWRIVRCNPWASARVDHANN